MSKLFIQKNAPTFRTHGAVHGEVNKGPSKRTEVRRLKSLRRKQARINRAVEKLTRGASA